MDQEFEQPQPLTRAEPLSEAEVKELLHRLSQSHSSEPPAQTHAAHYATLADVIEACQFDEQRVAETLVQLRTEQRAARVAEVLTELEAPTHRVERPLGGTYQDPLSRHNPFQNLRSTPSILDDLKPITNLKVTIRPEETDDRFSKALGWIILIAFALIGLATVLLGFGRLLP